MDGFSSAAAVIQLLAVTGACGNKLLKLIHTTKHAPSEIMAISNELSDLTLILNNLEGLIATEQKFDWPSTSGIAQPRLNVSIEKHVINAKAKLSNLQSLVDQPCTILPDGSAKVRRMAWARKKSIANTLQQDLISAKEILKLALDTRNAYVNSGLLLYFLFIAAATHWTGVISLTSTQILVSPSRIFTASSRGKPYSKLGSSKGVRTFSRSSIAAAFAR